MTPEEFEELKVGDTIQHKHTGKGWLVADRQWVGNFTQYLLVCHQHASNPSEWEKVDP